ncbi:MAG: 6-phosphogluconate dehydrogenase [Chloroflexia bacterium]|jgi:6-phosphogluconate dehydrogenase|nr:6-phosphogluconate dehydrogenase [Chloroflexia bacterium]
MEIGFIGLGRMGANMVERLLRGGHRVVAYNRSPDKTREVAEHGAIATFSLQELVDALQERPKAVWIMVPAGDPTMQQIMQLIPLLEPGDIIIDGGNSNFRDTIARSKILAEHDINFFDVGTSGGIWGLENGYCMMMGGKREIFEHLRPLFSTLAPNEDGYDYFGSHGAGHFTKMVHNGIEYGMMQAYAEGFEIIKNSDFTVDNSRLAQVWNNGSVVRSWLLELAQKAFEEEGDNLERIRGYVEDSGEGRWTVLEAIASSTPAPIITLSLMARFSSRQEESFASQVTAALRNQFGGHAVRVAEAIESQIAAESMKSVAPSTPATPATTVSVSSEDAANQVMDRTHAAEAAAEKQSHDVGKVVKDIQGTAQDIYGTRVAEPEK